MQLSSAFWCLISWTNVTCIDMAACQLAVYRLWAIIALRAITLRKHPRPHGVRQLWIIRDAIYHPWQCICSDNEFNDQPTYTCAASWPVQLFQNVSPNCTLHNAITQMISVFEWQSLTCYWPSDSHETLSFQYCIREWLQCAMCNWD